MDGIFTSAMNYYRLRQEVPPLGQGQAIGSACGIPIRQSNAFPFSQDCKACGGTGEGEESTYCPKCKGAGSIKYEGVMQSAGQTIILTGTLPRKFEPHFPLGIVRKPPLSRGLSRLSPEGKE